MEPTVFKPKYTPLTWALLLMYAVPWLYAAANVLFGSGAADWKLFWLLAGSVWVAAGLMHMKDALLRRITLDGDITVEKVLQKPASQRTDDPVRIRGDMAVFSGQEVQMQYLANAAELMQLFVSEAGRGQLNLVYEQPDARPSRWTMQKNLLCLIVFALYMMAMLGLRLRPLMLVGPATDALLLGWAVMLPVLLVVRLVQLARQRLRWKAENQL